MWETFKEKASNIYTSIFIVFSGVVCLTAGVAAFWFTYDNIQFNKNCIGVMGTLENKYTKKCRSFLCSYDVHYTFNYRGTDYTGSDTIDDEPKIKDVPVYFLPDDPNKNKAEKGGVLKQLLEGVFMIYAGIFALKKFK